MDKKKYRQQFILLSILLLVGILISLSLGRYSNNPLDVWKVISYRLGFSDQVDPNMESIVLYVRLPRIIAAIFVGSMLSLSGAVYQGVFRNPLVSADLLGVSSGASVGAALSIILGFSLVGRQIFAFLGGVLAVYLVTSIAKLLRNKSNMILVLSGIIVGGFLSAILGLIKFLAEEQTELASIVYWQMGSVSKVTRMEIVSILPVLLIASTILVLLSWRINILSFGELEAKALGIDIEKIRGIIIICASLLTSSAVSISGTIGWIGLVIPHLGRLLVGTDNTNVIPFSMIIGAIFMLIVDTLARTISTVEIPLSILTGFIGAPLFAYLLFKQRIRVE